MSPPAIESAAAATAAARGVMVVAKKAKLRLSRTGRGPHRSLLTRPSHTRRYLMYYLDEKGVRVYTLKVRARSPT